MSFDPYPGQEKDLRNVPIALTSVAFVLVSARLVTTYKNRGWFGAEDFFIIASVVRTSLSRLDALILIMSSVVSLPFVSY